MSFAGHENYSEAQFHCGRGDIFISYGHLGVDDKHLVASNGRAVRQVFELLCSGTLINGYAAFPALRSLPLGQNSQLGANGDCLKVAVFRIDR